MWTDRSSRRGEIGGVTERAPPPPSKPERGGEDRSLHVGVVAEVAAARRDIETALAEAQCDPRLQGIVQRADDLPIDMRSGAEPPKSPKAAIPAQLPRRFLNQRSTQL
jgi:hypothetical protein